MILTCICVNCIFYLTCWINKGLINFPVGYSNLRQRIRNANQINYDNLFYFPTLLKVQLNINSKTYTREPDIIFCDAFVESPGKWLIN